MFTIIDAVMGTGKSTAMLEALNHPNTQNGKYVIIVPSLPEVERYKQELSVDFKGNRIDIVALDTNESNTKTEKFMDAVSKEQTVITTHALFSGLKQQDLNNYKNIGEYRLIIDETIVLVGKHFVKDANLKLLTDGGYIGVVDHPGIKGLQYYELLPKGRDYLGQEDEDLRRTINAVSGKHVYKVNKHNVTFVVPPEKLTAFDGVFLLTYLFDGSETHGWLDLFQVKYEHKQLSNPPISAATLTTHSGVYTGKQFIQLLTIYRNRINDIGKKPARSKESPFTKSWYLKRAKKHEDIRKLRNNTRTFFRNMRADKKDMLWTCFKDYREWVRESHFDPKRGKETWLEQTERGTNDYADRHFLAFLVDAYPPVELSAFFKHHGVRFDEDNYALSRVLRWIWMSAIRKGDKITLYLPSERMRKLLEDWLWKYFVKTFRKTVN